MVTFAGVNAWLKEHGSSQIAGQVEAFLDYFRAGKCYLHPFDNNGDHEYYFTSNNLKITHLFVVGYHPLPSDAKPYMSFACFDGKRLDLVDVQTLLKHFLVYEHRLLGQSKSDPNDVEIDFEQKLASQQWLWAAFMICKDPEGETAMAAYSKSLKPIEGLSILRTCIHFRLLRAS